MTSNAANVAAVIAALDAAERRFNTLSRSALARDTKARGKLSDAKRHVIKMAELLRDTPHHRPLQRAVERVEYMQRAIMKATQ